MAEATLMEQATNPNDGEQTSETEQAASTDQAQSTEQTTEQESTQEQQKVEGAPEAYELKPLEGQEFDPEFLNVYQEAARELNLTNEAAQRLIDKVSPVLASQQAARIEAVRNEWAETSKADKEFGGDKLAENLSVAKVALDKFGTPELKQLINDSGLGNHPEMIRFFFRAGKQLSEDTFVGGHRDGAPTGPKNFNDMAANLYPNS